MKTIYCISLLLIASCACGKEVRGGPEENVLPVLPDEPWQEPTASTTDSPYPIYQQDKGRYVSCNCYAYKEWTEGFCLYMLKGVQFRITLDAAPILLPDNYCKLVW